MIITHHKGEFFKVTFGDTTLAFNPISKKSKIGTTKFGADIALVSLNHQDMNGVAEVTRSAKPLHIVDGPGEYEVNSVFIHGLPTESIYDPKNAINTIYAVNLEGMNILFLGALKDKQAMDLKITEEMDSVDILFVPIGNDGVLTASEAQALATTLEAKVVIPMHFDGLGTSGALKEFLKEAGAEDVKPVEKLTIKKKDLLEYNGNVVVIKS